MGNVGPVIVGMITLIVGVAMVAVVVSKNANTPAVFQAGGTAFSQIIGAAVAPVSGSNNFGAVGQTTAGTTS
jgi:hypothetical protein